MPKFRVGWRTVIYKVVEAKNRDQAELAARLELGISELNNDGREIAQGLVWCEELPDESSPDPADEPTSPEAA